MKHQWKILATAIMFLTRMPVGKSASGEPADLAESTQYFPLVGLLVGLLTAGVFFLTNLVWSSEIATVLTMVSAVVLTGGFHEEGLADVADSAGAWNRERKLDIMRDSRIGTYGALALILILLLKFVSLFAIAGWVNSIGDANTGAGPVFSEWVMVATLVLGHVLGRWSTLPLIRTTPYAREASSNKVFAEGVSNPWLLIGSVIALAVMVVCSVALGSVVVTAFTLVSIAIALSRTWFMRTIGGITGDCLGAANQVVEVIVYLCIAAKLT